jgi:hypothetical protein
MSTVTVDAKDFHNLLKTGLICAASPAQNLPMLAAVKLESTAKRLISVSTDRFRIGVTKIEAEGFLDGEALIPVEQVKQLASMLKPAARGPELKVTLTIVSATEYDRKLRWTRSDGLSGSIDLLTMDHPKWRHLMPGHDAERIDPSSTDHDAHRFACTPEYLASFAKAKWHASDGITVEAIAGKNKPIIIRVGKHFIGVLMPVRDSDVNSQENRDEWSSIIRTDYKS